MLLAKKQLLSVQRKEKLLSARLLNAKLQNARLLNAKLQNAKLQNAKLQNAKLQKEKQLVKQLVNLLAEKQKNLLLEKLLDEENLENKPFRVSRKSFPACLFYLHNFLSFLRNKSAKTNFDNLVADVSDSESENKITGKMFQEDDAGKESGADHEHPKG